MGDHRDDGGRKYQNYSMILLRTAHRAASTLGTLTNRYATIISHDAHTASRVGLAQNIIYRGGGIEHILHIIFSLVILTLEKCWCILLRSVELSNTAPGTILEQAGYCTLIAALHKQHQHVVPGIPNHGSSGASDSQQGTVHGGAFTTKATPGHMEPGVDTKYFTPGIYIYISLYIQIYIPTHIPVNTFFVPLYFFDKHTLLTDWPRATTVPNLFYHGSAIPGRKKRPEQPENTG